MKQVITHPILNLVRNTISTLSLLLLLTASSFAQNSITCNARFQFYSGVNPDSVHFYAASTGSTTIKYSWSFGDGTGSDQSSPWHYYTDSGLKIVCLTVSDSTQAGKCTDTWCDSIHIQGPPSPPVCNAQFVNYASVTNPDSIHFYPTGGGNTAKISYSWSFGDGTYSTAFNPWHEYSPGNYNACLTIYDTLSSTLICTNTYCDSIHIVPTNPVPCNANFTFRFDSVNTVYGVRFFSNANPPGTKYYWSFGDGITSTDPDPVHVYAHGGTYWVCLYVTDSAVCHSSWCDSVNVQGLIKPVCNAQFQFYSLTGNPDSVHFYTSTATTTTRYSWNFGDGTGSHNADPWHFFPNGGNHYVCLTVTDTTPGGICSATWCDSVHIAPPPPPCNAHFTTIRPGTVANYVYFVSAPNPPGTNYSWNFGDNSPVSTDQNPTHTFANDGTYQVCLTVTNTAIPCSETWCDSITIKTLKPICNAQFVYYSINTNADSIHFYVTPANLTGTSYSWTFGDGGTSTNSDPWHLYAHPGAYQVCLTVTNTTQGGVCTASWCDSVHIIGPPPPVCNAHFQFYSLNNPDSVHFYSSTAATVTTQYSWSFGDGTGSNDRYPWHYYLNKGTYYVCLTVTDSTSGGKCTDTQCDSVHIVGPPPPVCNAHFTHISANTLNTTIHFIPAPNAPGTSYSWDFGDGSSSSNMDPTHTYTNAGVYSVCLTVVDSTNNGVCTNTWCDSIHVGIILIPCNPHFAYKYGSNIHALYFVHAPNAPDTRYYWDFGDGTTSNDPNVLHQFANPGTYWVCLTVFDSISTCRATWCDSVHVGAFIQQVCNSNFYFKPGNTVHSLYFFSAPNPPGTQYSWDFGDGSPAVNTADAFHQYAVAGTYKVCLTVTDTVAGCSDTRCLTIGPLRMAEGGSTTDDQINTNNIVANVYPNPFTDYAVLHIENTSGAVTFRMFDNLGRLVNTMSNLANGDFNLSKQGLGSGIYLYEVIDGNNNVSRGKLVIQ